MSKMKNMPYFLYQICRINKIKKEEYLKVVFIVIENADNLVHVYMYCVMLQVGKKQKHFAIHHCFRN